MHSANSPQGDPSKRRKKIIEAVKKRQKNPAPQVTKKIKRKDLSSENMSIPKAKRLWFSARTKGRPSKTLSQELAVAKKVLNTAGVPLKRNPPGKVPGKRGRPKKNILKPTKLDPKRPRGRPRKNPLVEKVIRPRGRPRKHPVLSDKPKRPRGRPRKHPINLNALKRPRGRPKKPSTVDTTKKELKKKVE